MDDFEAKIMNWEAVTAVTEIAGLIAVIASLIYIGVQNKQANDHATASSETAWMDGLNRILTRGWWTRTRSLQSAMDSAGSRR